jgi:hypothetical protein
MGWKLNKVLGIMMAALYVVFLAIALTVDTSKPDFLRFD